MIYDTMGISKKAAITEIRSDQQSCNSRMESIILYLDEEDTILGTKIRTLARNNTCFCLENNNTQAACLD